MLYRDWSREHPVERPLPAMRFADDSWMILHSRADARRPLIVPECGGPDAPGGLLTAIPTQEQETRA